ncbi:hypothetical protein tb265_46560 [Gemmatimonadetes bacterium T265]|nr:hypothetical protein tb265_46560 [Gemmatimonadetes bacterium T265]
MSTTQPTITLGIDTHRDTHACAALDALGRSLGMRGVATTPAGYDELLAWARAFGPVTHAGIEGTGSYGAGVTRVLRDAGVLVVEINRPDRARRRRRGKNDPTDAENAARAVLSGDAHAVPKAQDGVVEALRILMVARRSAVKVRTQAGNQLRCLLITAPAGEHAILGRARLAACVARCLALEPTAVPTLEQARLRALRALARRWTLLTEALAELDAAMARLTAVAAPRLLDQHGVGPHTAATLLITAGDNPERLRSEAALAALCGVSPVEASSGRVTRHRLNRGGDRQANNALWTITLVRARGDARTQAYVERRTGEGRARKEIFRCLKRYIIRELYPLLLADLAGARHLALTWERQRGRRGVLRDARTRAAGRAHLRVARRGAGRHLRLRRLVQRRAAPLQSRVRQPRGLRAAPGRAARASSLNPASVTRGQLQSATRGRQPPCARERRRARPPLMKQAPGAPHNPGSFAGVAARVSVSTAVPNASPTV